MYSLTHLTLADMTHASAKLRSAGAKAQSMEEAGRGLVRFIYESFGDARRSSVLVRLYKTHAFGELPPGLQSFASTAAATELAAATRCLCLLATAGDEPAWNERTASRDHQAIPLLSPEAVGRLPMVAQLIVQLGFDVARVIAADPKLVLDHDQRTFNVFHVPEAKGSPYIPAQPFVERHGIASVLGYGGALPRGEVFAVIVFSRDPISRQTAELFRPLALASKLALLPFGEKVFAA